MKLILRVLLFLTCATLPLEHLGALQLVFVYMTPNKLASALLVVATAASVLISGMSFPKNRKNLWLIFLLGAVTVGLVHGALRGVLLSLIGAEALTYYSLLLFYAVICIAVVDMTDLKVFMWGIVVGTALGGVTALLGFSFSPEEVDHYARFERASGVAGGANQFAGNVLLAAGLSLALLAASRSTLSKGFLLGTLGLLAVAFIMTLSRSGFLAVIAMIMLWSFRFLRVQRLHYLFLLLAVVAVVAALAPDQYYERISTIFSIGPSRETYGSDITRLTVLLAGLRAFLSNPLMGVGAMNFLPWGYENITQFSGHTVHNAFFEVACEYGLLGLIPFAVVIAYTWFDFGRTARLCKRWRHRQDKTLQQLYLWALMTQIGFLGPLFVAQFQPGATWKGIWAMIPASTVMLSMARKRIQSLENTAPAPRGPLADPDPAPWSAPVRTS